MKNTETWSNLHSRMIHPCLPLSDKHSNAIIGLNAEDVWLEFWRTVRLMRGLLAPKDKRRIRVRITDEVPDDRLADTSKKKDHYLIRLRKSKCLNSPELAFLLLAHEWGHVLTWGVGNDHGDEWGIESAKCWRLVSGEIFGGLK